MKSRTTSINYELAKKDYRQMVKDGWTKDAAKNEACISRVLTLKEQERIWKLK
jgi:hypothetical protein